MKSNKIIFFPGLGESSHKYDVFSKYMKIADINWNTGEYIPKISQENIVITFSLGAIFPLEYIQKNKLRKIVLCSPTPFEDVGKAKTEQIVFIAGSKEKFILQNIKRVVKNLPKKIKSEIIVIPKAGHRITGQYQKKLIKLIKELR